MARIRTVKPSFWQDELLSEVSETAMLLAIGLLNHSDDEGYFNANPKIVHSVIFPLRDNSVSTHGALTELCNIGYIEMKNGSNKKVYGRVVNFSKHQRVNRPTASEIKNIFHGDDVTDCKLTEKAQTISDSLSTHGVLSAGKGIGKGKGNKEREEEEEEEGDARGDLQETQKQNPSPIIVSPSSTPVSQKQNGVDDIFSHWQTVMSHPQAKLDTKRRKAILAALKTGYTLDELKSAITGCSMTPHNMGTDPKGNGQRYDSLQLILRDADQIDRFIRNSVSQPDRGNGLLSGRRDLTMDEWLNESSSDSGQVFDHGEFH